MEPIINDPDLRHLDPERAHEFLTERLQSFGLSLYEMLLNFEGLAAPTVPDDSRDGQRAALEPQIAYLRYGINVGNRDLDVLRQRIPWWRQRWLTFRRRHLRARAAAQPATGTTN